ncbi:MAG: hypothetical protein AB1489_01705 [Acidobacteriota bacterium]
MIKRVKEKKKLFFGLALLLTLGVVLAVHAAIGPSSKEAREAIASIPGFEFDAKRVRVKSIENNGSGAVVEAQCELAFRLVKKKNWQVAEMRLSDGRWEEMDLIVTAVRNEKIRRTRVLLQELADAIASYQREQGYYPRARDVVELTDLLVPRYMNRVIRSDLWSNYLEYISDGKTYRLQSLGPDRKAIGDEILIENGKLIDGAVGQD